MPYHHFTREERYIVSHLVLAGFSFREIGRRIGKHHGSISREIKRNRPTYADDAVYWYDAAEFYEKERRCKARHHRRQHERLVAYVMERIKLDWPPWLFVASHYREHLALYDTGINTVSTASMKGRL